MLKADGLDEGVIGRSYDMAVQESRLVYSVQKCIKVLVDRDGMTHEEAREYLEHNTLCAYVGQYQPIFVDVECFEAIEDLYEDEE